MTRIATSAFMLAAAAGSYFAATAAADLVETETRSAAEQRLVSDGFDWAAVSVDGLAVVMTGQAPDEATRFAALTAVGTIIDAGRIANEMTVADAPALTPPDYVVEILRNDDGISLIGLIPDGSDTAAIIGQIEAATNGAPISDLLETASHPVPDGWADALSYALDILDRLPRSKVSVTAGHVSVSAVADTPEQRNALETSLNLARPTKLGLSLDISAPRPVISPFTLRFVLDDNGARFDACSADTNAARDTILAAARDAGLEGRATCPLGLGAPSRRWGDAAAGAIAAIAELGGGTLTISNADVAVVARLGASEVTFDKVIGLLDESLPGVFALTAIRPEPPEETDDTAAIAEFVATRSPEGLLQLRGRLPSEQSQVVIASYAAAQFGSAGLSPATRVDDTLPSDWSNRVLAALEALGELNNGAVIVSPTLIDISGVSGRNDAAATVARILSDRLEDGSEFAIDVAYAEELDPEAGLPTPEECVTNINAVLAETKIIFAPSSSDIDPSGRDVINAIADILRDCSAARMEIAGHTDSQGRESMNLSLSQARADAVMNAILARRVSVANLTAKGYGEANPIASNDTAEGREANRRIEFTLIVQDAPAEDGTDAETATDSEEPTE